jgi:hypothetical protein
MMKYLKIEHATHTLTILFGITSLANVNAFLRGAGHDPIAAVALSVALGAALIVISIALTQIDWQSEQNTFRVLAVVGGLLAIISGALQSAEYATHLHGAWPYLLGYGVPVVGEIGLSLATALYLKALRRSELRAVHTKMERAVVSVLDEAIASFDPSTIKRRIDRSLNTVAARAVDGVTHELMNFYGAPQAENEPVGELAEPTIDISPNVLTTWGDPTIANAARMTKKAANLDKALRLIETGQHSVAAIADEIGVTTKTITRYVDKLRGAGHNISVNGVVKLLA